VFVRNSESIISWARIDVGYEGVGGGVVVASAGEGEGTRSREGCGRRGGIRGIWNWGGLRGVNDGIWRRGGGLWGSGIGAVGKYGAGCG